VPGATRAGVGSTYLVFPTIGPTWERVPSTRGHHGGMCQKAAAKALVVASRHRGQGAGSDVACLSQLGQTWARLDKPWP
jgi:hypothetical protein